MDALLDWIASRGFALAELGVGLIMVALVVAIFGMSNRVARMDRRLEDIVNLLRFPPRPRQ